jgi:ATP-dependent helicase HrpA
LRSGPNSTTNPARKILKITFPEALPVSQHRNKIRDAIRDHPVTIVCGDTGSGKTTQLPKIALELRRGQRGRKIGCTQPRRIAATSVAKRVAEEMEVKLGEEVGYQIRFENRTQPTTKVKFMTDGVLLAETRNNRLLKQYDTLIIDEAHERSLNIDFILGYLSQILKERDDLKVIISSATLDAESFADFFDGAPIISVEGRTFPVEDHYLPPYHDREPMAEQILRAAEWLGEFDPLGDTLVFLPGEREIRDAADLLEGRNLHKTVVLPLFARMAGNDQQRVFRTAPRERRIILATNVAETSLTIPGIQFVIDSGLARVNRFDPGSGIQRLQVEAISQASARQRRGRCGRVSDGVCVRLYEKEDFEERAPFTDPEILRCNLAAVVLQMEHLGLGDPLEFPFVDPPQPKRVAEAYLTLKEIGALPKKGGGLTEIGRDIARMPLDPRVGRVLVEARELDCVREALIVASAITVQDPRERPQEKREAADQAHAKFRDKTSDFTGWLRIWHAVETERKHSNNSLRRFCQKNFLNYRRTQEWLNLHRELRDVLREMKWKLPNPKQPLGDPKDSFFEDLHRCILSAIPSQIGFHQGKGKGYHGARDRNFFLHPASGVSGSAPTWIMAFEMVETARLFARNVAQIDPSWYEKAAPHLCRYRYGNPQWDPVQGAVYGTETVMAYGLILIDNRRVHYGRVNLEAAREIFIHEALVNGNTRSPLPALAKNRDTLERANRLEHKMRRRDGLVFPQAIVGFFDERIPKEMCTQREFERWIEKEPEGVIDFTLEDCTVPQIEPLSDEDLPDELWSPDGTTTYPLSFHHMPTEEDDGVSVDIPLADLAVLPDWFGDWLVPGWANEKLQAMLRALAKPIRQSLPPAAAVCADFWDAWQDYAPECTMEHALLEHLRNAYDQHIEPSAIDEERVPKFLQMRFRVIGDNGKPLAAARNLAALREHLADRIQARFAEVAQAKFQQKRLSTWTIGDLPERVELERNTPGFPALVDVGPDAAAVEVFETRDEAAWNHPLGVARLFRLVEKERVAQLKKTLFDGPTSAGAAPSRRASKSEEKKADFNSLGAAFGDPVPTTAKVSAAPSPPKETKKAQTRLSQESLALLKTLGLEPGRNREDLVTRIIIEALGGHEKMPRNEADFKAVSARARTDLFAVAETILDPLDRIIRTARTVSIQLESPDSAYSESTADAHDHFNSLLRPGWLLAGSLTDLDLDLRGLETRLTRMFGSPPMKDLAKLERFRLAAAEIHKKPGVDSEIDRRNLAAEENDLRLHHFAPELRGRRRGSVFS